MKVRVYVMMGQGGRFTSGGIVNLAARIDQLKGTRVSVHPWDPYTDVVDDINKLLVGTKIAIVGYSLGANATTWIATAVPKRKIDLIVCYDPSKWSIVTPAPKNVAKGILYHNNGWDILGHAVIPGPQMQTVEISQWHLSVDNNEDLHRRTLAEINELLK